MAGRAIRYDCAVERLGLLTKLRAFQVEIAGTAPLGLSVADSDIDVLCFSPTPEPLEQAIWGAFGHEQDFSLRRWIGGERPVIAMFKVHNWTFQIYGSDVPVREQMGWKLYQAEIRLLAIGGRDFKEEIMRRRAKGMKTIPAMMSILGRAGDPYAALIDTACETDEQLREGM